MGFQVRQFLLLFVSSTYVMAQGGGISGFTIDAFDGSALPRAHIKLISTLESDWVRDAWSDEMGRFSIPSVKPGSYRTEAELNGYHRVFVFSNSEVQSGLNVKGESHVEGVHIFMSKDAFLTARVVNEDRSPISGVTIDVKPIPEKGVRVMRERKNGSAGEGGECRFVLTPGRYKVSTSLNTPVPSPENISRAAMYEPAETEVEVSADLRSQVDLTIRRRKATDGEESVSGTVRGRPSGSVYTTVWMQSGPSPDSLRSARSVAITSGDGSFRFTELNHEFHRIFASCCNRISLYSQVVDLTPNDKNSEAVELVLAPTFSVKGTLEWSDELGVLSVPISLRSVVNTPQSAMDCCPHSSGLGVNGPFEIRDVPPGVYRVDFYDRHSNVYVKQVLLGATELKDGILDLRNGDPDAPLKIVVSSKAGKLRLNLVDEIGRPTNLGKVMLIQEGGFNPGRVWTPNWLEGTGSDLGFYGLPPGKYRILWTDEPIDYLLDLDPEWLTKAAEDSEEIEIHEYDGKEQTRTLKRAPNP